MSQIDEEDAARVLFPDDAPKQPQTERREVSRPKPGEERDQSTNNGRDDQSGDDDDREDEAQPETLLAGSERYELTMPEGFELDRDLLEEATPVLRELGLSNAQASKLTPLVIRAQERFLDQLIGDHAVTQADWANQAKADPVLGKNWNATMSNVARALDVGGAVRGGEFRSLLDESGLGNHPEFIRVFNRLGAALGKASGVKAGPARRTASTSRPQQSREEIMYPNDTPKPRR